MLVTSPWRDTRCTEGKLELKSSWAAHNLDTGVSGPGVGNLITDILKNVPESVPTARIIVEV
jgi:hypothetical protein